MKRRRLYDVIIPLFIVACITLILAYSYKPSSVPEALENPSEEHGPWSKAYDYAKEGGKSDFYAKAYAEQIAEGKGKIYAKAYAFALEVNQKDIEYDDKMKKVWARIYAEKLYEGQTLEYAARYALNYCKMLPVAIEQGQDEKFVHQYVKYYFDTEELVKRRFPQIDSKYLKDFSTTYALLRASGITKDRAVEKAMDYADSKIKEQDPASAFRQAVRRVLPPSEMNKDLLSALEYYPDLHIRIINYLTAEKGSRAWTLALGKLNIGLQRAGFDGKIFDSINALHHALRADSTFNEQVKLVIRNEMKRK